jgi:hypothetical protein
MQEISGGRETSGADETSKESLDKSVEEYRDWKEKYEQEQKKELAKDLEPYDRPKPAYMSATSETLKSSMRGEYEQPALAAPVEAEAPAEAAGPSSMSTDLMAAIADANGLPPEQRRQAVADMNKKYGKEIGNLRTGVLRDGKGVVFYDTNGKEYTVNYE